MKYYKTAALLIFVFSLADNAIGLLFPIDYTYQQLSYVPHLSLVMMLIFCRDLNWQQALLIGASTGLFMDLAYYQTFPIHLILYTLLAVVLCFASDWMPGRRFSFLLILFLILMSDFIPYLIQYMTGVESVPVHTWFVNMQALSLLINGCAIFCMDEIWMEISAFARQRREKQIQDSIHI